MSARAVDASGRASPTLALEVVVARAGAETFALALAVDEGVLAGATTGGGGMPGGAAMGGGGVLAAAETTTGGAGSQGAAAAGTAAARGPRHVARSGALSA